MNHYRQIIFDIVELCLELHIRHRNPMNGTLKSRSDRLAS